VCPGPMCGVGSFAEQDLSVAPERDKPDKPGQPTGLPVQSGPRRGLGIHGVCFAQSASELAVRTVHFHHLDTDADQVAGQAGALHPDLHDPSAGPQPAAPLLIAGGVGSER